MADKPKTQNTLSAEEQKEQPAPDEARAKRLATFQAALDPSSPEYRPDIAKALDEARAKLRAIDFQPINDFLQELSTLEPFIKAELAKVPGGETLDDYLDKYTAGELLDMIQDPGSAFAQALKAARIAKQVQGRHVRKGQREKAEDVKAIMTIKGGYYPLPSEKDLWNAFAPGKIVELGTLDKTYIGDDGRIKKMYFDESDFKPIIRTVPIQAFLVLSAVVANSVENTREEFVKSGELRFYVKGVIDTLLSKPHGLIPPEIAADGQLDILRKTPGVLWLENLFKPLQNYVGTMPSGSRWTVLNYIGYDADSDTMIIKSPYLYQLWYGVQDAYFSRRERIEAAKRDDKKAKYKDYTPLEINSLLKGPALAEDPSTLEMAIYITNVMLNAGKQHNPIKTRISFKTIIKNCPTVKRRLADIESGPDIITEQVTDKATGAAISKTRKINKTAVVNSELRKFERLYNVLMDTRKSAVVEKFEILSISPTRTEEKCKRDGSITSVTKFIPPTKSQLDNCIEIVWQPRKAENDEPTTAG